MCAALPSCFNKPPGEKYIPMLMLANVVGGQCSGWTSPGSSPQTLFAALQATDIDRVWIVKRVPKRHLFVDTIDDL